MGDQLYTSSNSGDFWPSILEKAYAKLHRGYSSLDNGSFEEALIDFTGCPTSSFPLPETIERDRNALHDFWQLLLESQHEGFLLAAQASPNPQLAGLSPSTGYAIIGLEEIDDELLVQLRNPWGEVDTESVLFNSPETPEGTIWVPFSALADNFDSVVICKVKNWDEIRIKGKFIRVQDLDDQTVEVVMSKWYYSLEVDRTTKIHISIHQEDIRFPGVELRRPYLDAGVVLLQKSEDGALSWVDIMPLACTRQSDLEVVLEPGSYIVLPRTTGCTLRKPPDAVPEQVTLVDYAGHLTQLAEITVVDIFRKFDMLLNRELTYSEFQNFYEAIGMQITETEFRSKILNSYTSSTKGITLTGFKEYWTEMIKVKGKDVIRRWLDSLGYNQELYGTRSRSFVTTFHCETELSIVVSDTVQTDLDNKANILILEKVGSDLENRKGVRLVYYADQGVDTFSYGILNETDRGIKASIDCGDSQNMMFSTPVEKVEKFVPSGGTEFFMHAMVLPSAESYHRSAAVEWTWPDE